MSTATEADPRLDPDPLQARVLEHVSGPLAVLGGPGTGKTATLTERFIWLAKEHGPDRVMLLVPNRAHKIAIQNEITERLLIKEGLEALIEVPVYTWHGFAHHLVTRNYDRLAYPEPPVLLTSPEQWGDIRDALASEDPARWPHHRDLLTNRGFVDEVVDFVIRAEQRMLEASDLERLAQAKPEWAELISFYKAHQVRLRQRSRVDYPTLLYDAVELIAQDDEVRGLLRDRFRHVLVDDAQELALVQQRLLVHLCGKPGEPDAVESLVLAADPDSAIETFRGADPRWLAGLDEAFGPTAHIVLPTSYRLGSEIGEKTVAFVGSGSRADHHPTEYVGGSILEAQRHPSLGAEVQAIARALRHAHLADGIDYEDMAILLTSPRSMLPALERALIAVEVPFTLSAPDRPLEREPAVRAVIDLARFAYDPSFDEDDLLELLRSPLAGLPDSTVRELERLSRLAGKPLSGFIEAIPDEAPGADDVRALVRLRDLVAATEDSPADETFWQIWDSSLFCKRLVADARTSLSHPANRDLDALVAFSRALGRFVERRRGDATLKRYLEAISRADFGSDPWLPPERRRAGVEVLSFHAARGREWSIVAVAGITEGAIPKGRRAQGLFDPYVIDDDSAVARAKRAEAEDRRVLYVALTRARERCIVTTSPGPSRRAAPSRFLDEIVGELEIEDTPDPPPLTFSEAAGRARRVIGDTEASPVARIAAMEAITLIHRLDPTCAAADPAQWWWRWDWSEGAVPIRSQHPGDDDVPIDKLRTSYSRIGTFENCGLQYLGQVVLGLDPDTSHNMSFGTWVHKVFEEWETPGKAVTDVTTAMARFNEMFDPSVFPNRAMARQFHHDGLAMIERYNRFLKPGRAKLVEKRFRVNLDGHVITGRIDRVDSIGKKIVVTDYKTSRSPMHWNDAKESLQLAIYYLAATSDQDLIDLGEPVSMQLVYPAVISRGEVAKRCQTVDEAKVVLETLPELMDDALAERFNPRAEANCMWCKFKPLCPIWPEGRELPL